MQSNCDVELPRLRSISQLWSCAAVLAALGVAALALDVPLATWAHRGVAPSFLYKLCSLSETVGHGVGILLIAVTIFVLDPARRVALPRLLAAALGSGLAANLLKLSLARTRPAHFHWNGNGFDTFCDWFPLLGNSSWTQSFPSSHTAVAAGLAVALSWMYPRGRWLFPAFAALAGGQRILEEAHYLSDVLWGAAVGRVFAPLCVYGSGLAQFFDRLEAQLTPEGAALPKTSTVKGRGATDVPTHEHPRAA